MRKVGPIDFKLLFFAVAILIYGLIMVLSSGAVQGYNATNTPYFYFLQQLKWAILGVAGALVALLVPYKFWRRFAGIGIILSFILLFAVLFSEASVTLKGSARWLKIGEFFSFQPSEIAKLALVLFYAHILDRYPVRHLKDLALPLGVLLPLLALVYKQPDLGTTMVLLLTAAAMLLRTELPLKYFFMAVPVFGLPLFYLVRHMEYQWTRILVWLNPWAYASDDGYQIINAQIAFGSGGLFGVGLGQSRQKYGFLPENFTDMIFAIIGEELGLWGTLLLMGLFIGLFVRGYKTARECPDRFTQLFAFGLTSTLAIQTAINLAVVTGVFPVTGITLPLISYGGSSLFVTMVEIGLLLNLSRWRKAGVDSGLKSAKRGILGRAKETLGG